MVIDLDPESEVRSKAEKAKLSSKVLARLSTETRNRALLVMADALEDQNQTIIEQNEADMKAYAMENPGSPLLDRLMLNQQRIRQMAESMRQVAKLPDPIGEVVDGWRTVHGLEISKIRVPFGLVAIIYEARPDVTADAVSLCIKSGNSVLLRGGSEAIRSNKAIVKVLTESSKHLIPPDSIQMIETTDRRAVNAMLNAKGLIDLLIPRGGASLINFVTENSKVPVIETGVGNCHVYIDDSAKLEMASDIIYNAKVQRPAVCNAAKKLLIHSSVAQDYLPEIARRLRDSGVILKGCSRTRSLIKDVEEAKEEDWYTEFLDMTLAVKVVDSIEEAIEHINKYGSKHSEAIVTENYERAQEFLDRVDAAVVYVNASTRFTDGFQFGLGAEIGISTQKLHARGPMGLRELTTTKYVVRGKGQIRK
ncbi:MAG: glutamate-5-semialdehyde dehydrogenase [Thermoproteota archaeon]